jgi:hypothetical protein
MTDDEKSVIDVFKRAVIGFVVLTVGLTLLGGIGSLLMFDGAIGDAEADFAVWISEHRVDVLDTVANNAGSLSDTWTVIGVVVGAVIAASVATGLTDLRDISERTH